MIYQIAAGVVAVAFLALVIAIIVTLRSVNRTLDRATKRLEEVSGDVQILLKNSSELVEETKSTIQLSRKVVQDTQSVVEAAGEDVQAKLRKIDTLFLAVKEVGDQIRQVSASVAKEAEANSGRIGKVVSLVSAGMDIARKWKKN